MLLPLKNSESNYDSKALQMKVAALEGEMVALQSKFFFVKWHSLSAIAGASSGV